MTKIRKIKANSLQLLALLIIPALVACSAAPGYRINYFQAGKVVVDGKVYRYDVVIMPDGSVHHAPAGESHLVDFKDIEEFIGMPETRTLVVGAGTEDKVELDEELPARLKAMGIKIMLMSTEDAIRMMNRSPKEGVVMILHINC